MCRTHWLATHMALAGSYHSSVPYEPVNNNTSKVVICLSAGGCPGTLQQALHC
jgi:hypothetical protein